MGRGRAGRAASAWARLLRWLGPDRNPLRRTVDRVEAAVLAVLCAAFLVGAPWAALAAGQWAASAGARVEHAEAGWRQVRAVLLEKPPLTAQARSQASLEPQALARWTAPDGTARTGTVYVLPNARPGASVLIWVDSRGQLTGAPVRAFDVVNEVVFMALAAFLGCAALMSVLAAGAHLAANRRRLAAWDIGWSVAGPQWSGRR